MTIVIIKIKRREVLVDIEKVKELEGQKDVTFNEICRVFDNHTYETKVVLNKKVNTNIRASIWTTYYQFFESVEEYKNPKNKKQLLYKIGKLHNPDGQPLVRIENKNGQPLSDFTAHLEALVLLSLEYNLLPAEEKTINKWVEHFGLVNENQIKNYNTLKYNGNEYTILKAVRKNVDTMIEVIDFDGELIKRQLSDDEILAKVSEMFYSIDTVAARLSGVLDRLDKHKLIEHHKGYTYAVIKAKTEKKKKLTKEEQELEQYYKEEKEKWLADLSSDERYEIEQQELKKNKNQIFKLDSTEKSNLTALKLDVKKEIELMKEHEQKVNRFTSVQLTSNKLKVEGLVNEKGETNYYDYTFETSTINRFFTNKELNRYLDKHKDVKQVYEQGVEEVVNKYNDLRLEHLVKWFEKKCLNNLSNIEELKFNESTAFGSQEAIELLKLNHEFNKMKIIKLQEEYLEFGKRLAEVMLLDKYRVSVNINKIATN
ncbi:hypothetical protein [Macrococcus carouselicus]|uniref:Uncharacterized protein n=1 Tax=Macrococcus carouselicus TaxID=69969 RepID=A0A9Q8CML6_9STAP|nr:hypothetical protein [Macrococcus carouselicus]TDM04052.1 hypothetical protein ERX40_02465 [Macrococcus carouselicus]